jgi:hypothetical protein
MHIARIHEIRKAYVVLFRMLEGKKPAEDVDVNGKIILKCILDFIG